MGWLRRQKNGCKYGACDGRALPEERYCERHVLRSNELSYEHGFMSTWVDLELELWPPDGDRS